MQDHDTSPRLDAILWDMDGTLIDTEPEWIASEHRLVEEFGGTWTHEDALSLVGQALTDSAKDLRERGGVALDDDELIARLIANVVAAVRREPQWRPGALALLAEARAAGIPLALVTMSYASLADAVLDGLPDGTFDVVVTGEVVTQGKPHPEPYLRAAERLGVDITRCLAIEDSLAGVTSAHASGAAVVVVEHMIEIPDHPERTKVASLEDIDLAGLRALAQGHQSRR